MKAHINKDKLKLNVSVDEVRQMVNREFEEKFLDLYKEATADITAQVLANVLVALEQSYGWKEKRLRDFINALHATEDSMVTPSPLHKTYTTLDNEEHLKNKFNIDLRVEFPASEVVVKQEGRG